MVTPVQPATHERTGPFPSARPAARGTQGRPVTAPAHDAIHRAARCHDVAFGFRDIGAECDTPSALAARHGPTGEPPRSMLELAAGPARHAREFARRGAHAAALDTSPAMCDYARAQAVRDGVGLDVVCADMRAFDNDASAWRMALVLRRRERSAGACGDTPAG